MRLTKRQNTGVYVQIRDRGHKRKSEALTIDEPLTPKQVQRLVAQFFRQRRKAG